MRLDWIPFRHDRLEFEGLLNIGCLESLDSVTACSMESIVSVQCRRSPRQLIEFQPHIGIGAYHGNVQGCKVPDSHANVPETISTH
jgi:hypothetical protein